MRDFIEIIQVATGRRDSLGKAHTPERWRSIVETARKQAMTGVLFTAIERLPAQQRPPREVILSLYVMVQRIERSNGVLTGKSVEAVERFNGDGFEACILKGQGNAMLYPEHLRKRRMSGDIDVWVLPKGFGDMTGREAIRKVIDHVHTLTPGTKATYHHIDFPVTKSVEIEVHYRPAFLYTPYRDRILQKWFLDNAAKQFANTAETPCGELAVPAREFNIVFQLCHMYKHLFEEGVGLRQLMDYYYVLVSAPADEERQREAVDTIRKTGMMRFARAVMWVLGEVFAMEENLMFARPDRGAGTLLLREIEATGNFGHMDTRFGDKAKESNGHRIARVTAYDLKFFWYYPEEVIWNPLFKIYHWCWRKRMN